jgi:cell division protein FtsL
MLRFVNICLVLGLVALAYVIYEVKYEARALDAEIAALKKDIETERDAVAVLRAEWSLLNRPERIERLAQKYLKLAPARPSQLVTLDTLKDSDLEWSRMAAKDEASKPADSAKTVAAKPNPAKTVAAETIPPGPVPAEGAAGVWTATTVPAGPKAKTPILATSAWSVTVSASGE